MRLRGRGAESPPRRGLALEYADPIADGANSFAQAETADESRQVMVLSPAKRSPQRRPRMFQLSALARIGKLTSIR